jgi:hypothetical protein
MRNGGNVGVLVYLYGHAVVVLVKPRSCIGIHELVTASPRKVRAEESVAQLTLIGAQHGQLRTVLARWRGRCSSSKCCAAVGRG